ncbi:MAG: hypothetical protein ACRELD_15095 [Longimicrobiales bacterium]
MVTVISLWLPILLSAVLVFVVSALIHMVLRYHRNDYRRLANEDAVLGVLQATPPGDYIAPYASTPQDMKAPEYLEKRKRGPLVIMTVAGGAQMGMGKQLLQWFLYAIVVGVFAAYIAGRAVPPGGAYLEVFRFAGTTAFIGYSLALWHDSIWYKRAWGTTLRFTLDGLIYALLTAGTFGWLWPAATL